MIKNVTMVIFIVFLLSGCVQKRVLDDISIITGMGYDLKKDGKIEGIATIPNYLPDKSVKNINYSAISTKTREIILQMQRQSSDPLVTGSIEVVLFGEKIAQKGVIDIVDLLQRDSTIGERLFLGVVEGNAGDILKQDLGIRGNAAYISNLFQNNIDAFDLPKTNLHLFLFDFFQEGKDPYLPKIKKIGKKKLMIDGVSILKDDKLVYTVPRTKMFFFKLLADKYSQGYYKVHVNGNQAAIHDVRSKHKFELSKKKPTEITVHIKIKGGIRAYSGRKINKQVVNQIEKNLEKLVNKESLRLIDQFKDIGVDPLGFGHFVKTKTRNFDFKRWEADYANLKVKVVTEATLVEAGVIE
jgi:spore germination protein